LLTFFDELYLFLLLESLYYFFPELYKVLFDCVYSLVIGILA